MKVDNPGRVLGESKTPKSLVEGLQSGNEEAWQRFMASYGENLKRWLGQLLGRHTNNDLDDLFNEFALRVFQSWPKVQYDSQKSFKGWLVTTAKRMWLNVVKARKSMPANLTQNSIDWNAIQLSNLDEADLEFDETHERILKEAEAFVEQQVSQEEWQCYIQVVHLFQRVNDVAASQGLPTSTVSARYRRILGRVRSKALELLELE